MIKAKLAVCGEKAIRDAISNKISVVNIIESIKSPGFPLFVPELTCLFITERSQKDPESIDCFIRFSLDKKELNIVPGKISYTDKLLNRFILVMNGLLIPKPGMLRVSLFSKENNKEIAFWKIAIEKVGKLAKKEQSQI